MQVVVNHGVAEEEERLIGIISLPRAKESVYRIMTTMLLIILVQDSSNSNSNNIDRRLIINNSNNNIRDNNKLLRIIIITIMVDQYVWQITEVQQHALDNCQSMIRTIHIPKVEEGDSISAVTAMTSIIPAIIRTMTCHYSRMKIFSSHYSILPQLLYNYHLIYERHSMMNNVVWLNRYYPVILPSLRVRLDRGRVMCCPHYSRLIQRGLVVRIVNHEILL